MANVQVVKTLVPLVSSYVNNKNKLLGFQQEISKETFLPIKLNNLHISMGNALRRIFMSEVPTYAFAPDSIKIQVNTSQYHQQVLRDRIGFITININDLKTYNIDDLVFAIGDPSDPAQPLKNKTNGIMMVYLHEYMYIQDPNKKVKIDAKKLLPQNSLLLTLNPGEEFHALMKATSSTGVIHPRWQSAVVLYKFETAGDSKGSAKLDTNEEQMTYLGYENKEPKGIIITVESVGKLNSNTIVQKGIEVLKVKLETIKQHLQPNFTSNKITLIRDENLVGLLQLKITGEDHTIGHVLANACFNKLKELIKVTIDINEKDLKSDDQTQHDMAAMLESLSNYKKPHPLKDEILVSVKTPYSEKYQLIFPNGQYDEITDPALRVLFMAIDDVQKLCDRLQEDAKVLS